MNQPDDLDLRSRFEAQRREDAAAARGFASTAARARRRPSGRGVHALFTTAAAVAVTVAIVIAIAVRALGPDGQPRIDLAATRWTGPTDFLLEVPGAALLRSTPSLDPAGAGAISDFQWRTP